MGVRIMTESEKKVHMGSRKRSFPSEGKDSTDESKLWKSDSLSSSTLSQQRLTATPNDFYSSAPVALQTETQQITPIIRNQDNILQDLVWGLFTSKENFKDLHLV